MATYVSKGGEWHPAKERVALKNKSDKVIKYDGKEIQPGEDFIYEGPDREALNELHKQNVEFFGHNFRDDNEFLEFLHRSRFKGDMDAYLKYIRYNEEEEEKKFQEKASKVRSHEIPKRVKAINELAGGRDTAGNQSYVGGFGEQQLTPATRKE